MKPLSQIIDPKKVFAIQSAQYRDSILLADTVPALSSKLGKVGISNLGHFYSTHITGTFEAIGSPAGAVVDTGLSYLSGQLIDSAGNRKLFSDRIPLDLWLSPGRRKSALSTTVIADPVGNSLFFPLEFEYLWTVNSEILLDVVNSSDEAVSYEIMFHGFRILSGAVAEDVRRRG